MYKEGSAKDCYSTGARCPECRECNCQSCYKIRLNRPDIFTIHHPTCTIGNPPIPYDPEGM